MCTCRGRVCAWQRPVRVSSPVLRTDAVVALAGATKMCLCFWHFSVSKKWKHIFSRMPKSCFNLSPSHPGVMILGPWQSSGSDEPPRKADPKSNHWERSPHLLVPLSDLALWRTLRRLVSGRVPHSDMLCSYSPNPVQSWFFPAVCAFPGCFSHCC